MDEPDLDCFPLLRPDQIPFLSKAWLDRSQAEIVELIASSSEASLSHYARQQHSMVAAELQRRRAAQENALAPSSSRSYDSSINYALLYGGAPPADEPAADERGGASSASGASEPTPAAPRAGRRAVPTILPGAAPPASLQRTASEGAAGSIGGARGRRGRPPPAWLRPSEDAGMAAGSAPLSEQPSTAAADAGSAPVPRVLPDMVASRGVACADRTSASTSADAAASRSRAAPSSARRHPSAEGTPSSRGSVQRDGHQSAREAAMDSGRRADAPWSQPPVSASSVAWGSAYVVGAPAEDGPRRRKKRTWEVDADARKRAEKREAAKQSAKRDADTTRHRRGGTAPAATADDRPRSVRVRDAFAQKPVAAEGASEGTAAHEHPASCVAAPPQHPGAPAGNAVAPRPSSIDESAPIPANVLPSSGLPSLPAEAERCGLSIPSGAGSLPSSGFNSIAETSSAPSVDPLPSGAAPSPFVHAESDTALAPPSQADADLLASSCADRDSGTVIATAPSIPPHAEAETESNVDAAPTITQSSAEHRVESLPWRSQASTAAPYPDLEALMTENEVGEGQGTDAGADSERSDSERELAASDEDEGSSDYDDGSADNAHAAEQHSPQHYADAAADTISSGPSVSSLSLTTTVAQLSTAPVKTVTPRKPPTPPPPRAYVYLSAFPEFKSIFSGCLASSHSRSIASGGLSGSAGRSDLSVADAALTCDQAAHHVLSALSSWKAFQHLDPTEQLRLAQESCALGAADASATIDDDGSGAGGALDTHGNDGGDAEELGAATPSQSVLPSLPSDLPVRFYRVMTGRGEVAAIVRRALTGQTDWHELPAGVGTTPVWSLLWSWGKAPVNRNLLLTWQKVNHFTGIHELTRKDLLKKNLGRYTCLGPKMAAAFCLQPPTFVLPKEYLPFAEQFGRGRTAGSAPGGAASLDALSRLLLSVDGASAATSPAAPAPPGDPNLWIMKPVGLSRGRGISLISDISQVRYAENTIIQKYIPNPLLLDGYKFDLRLYVLVTSFQPVEAFLYRRGFARLSSQPFSIDPGTISNMFIHLTNSSIQRHNGSAAATVASLPGATAANAGGTKISLEYLWGRLSSERGIDTSALWESIKDVIVKSLVCVDDVMPSQPNGFELLGYDILIDAALKPWLIEVNSSPSLGTDSAFDGETKTQLIADTIALVDPVSFDHAALARMLDARLGPSRAAVGSSSPALKAAGRRAAQAPVVPSDAERDSLEDDLAAVLRGRLPRAVGEMPANLGHYDRICPGSLPFLRAMNLKFAHFRAARPGGPSSIPPSQASSPAGGGGLPGSRPPRPNPSQARPQSLTVGRGSLAPPGAVASARVTVARSDTK